MFTWKKYKKQKNINIHTKKREKKSCIFISIKNIVF